jgi:diguanylate cyclase (GGDEF)-like protein/PAS domain S-box-containing protein
MSKTLPRTILLVQDDPTGAMAVREALLDSASADSCDAPFHVEWVRSCSEALTRLSTDDVHRTDTVAAVLVDLFLPDGHGIETFDRLFLAAPHIPILILSSLQDEPIAKLAVQRGAQDYLLRSHLDSYWLPKTIMNMLERAANAEALFDEQERANVTLNSIGDAVITTNVWGDVTYLNAVAERLTGWPQREAVGHPIEHVLHIIEATTRDIMPNPMTLATRHNKAVALTPNCLLIRRDEVEVAIEDSAAPIHDRRGMVTGAVMVFHDVTLARAHSLKMSYLAEHDNLTDLPNRILFNDRLTQAMALARRHLRQLSLLFLDVDHFKHINDSLGHVTGDRLLQSIAQRLRNCVRRSDTVSRAGGDEFVILLSEMTHAQDAAIVADKVLRTLRTPHLLDAHTLHVTASIGIVTYPDDGADAETLLQNADSAMYHAKDSGRDSYQFFKPDMTARAVERQSLESGMRDALDRREFVLLYQPKVDLETREILGVEALIRWHHPQRGLVPPAHFIPVAEKCGFIVPIGRWALSAACHQARAWRDAGLPPMRIAVNVSAVEVRADDFVAGVSAILTESGLEARYLELELTETFLMQDSKATGEALESLSDIGVLLAVDDFGTGYSSLSHLKRLPIHALKIDQSFVRDITTDPDDASIVSAVISMGRSLNMRVVAEGVETRDQLEFLQQQRCPEGQGYYFSRPIVADDLTQLLQRGMANASFV